MYDRTYTADKEEYDKLNNCFFGMKAIVKDGICKFEDGRMFDLNQLKEVDNEEINSLT